jgi:pyrroline-5-carboxylate reductase
MKLGFLGTGAITSAIVTGLKANSSEGLPILLSPRNPGIAARLAAFPGVAVASSNQDVLDHCDVVVIAVRPQVVQAVLSELRFRSHHHVISLVSTYPLKDISQLVAPAQKVVRAVPLPAAAKKQSPTAIYPQDQIALDLFASVGTSFAVDTEPEFDALCAVTATAATYFTFAGAITSWLARRGVPESKARNYINQIFHGLSNTSMEEPAHTFQSLAADHATRGGINEQVLNYLAQRGMFDAVSEALDAVLQRFTSRPPGRKSGPDD